MVLTGEYGQGQIFIKMLGEVASGGECLQSGAVVWAPPSL